MTMPPVPAAPPPAGGRARLPWIVMGVAVVVAVVVGVLLLNGNVRSDGTPVGSSPTPSTPGLIPADAGVVAEGRAVPLRRVELAFAVGGRVTNVPVAEGDTVAAGDLLVQLDTASADDDVASALAAAGAAAAATDGAEAAVRQAQASVDAAAAAVEQAQASRRAAAAARDQLPSGATRAVERQADAEVAGAEAAVDVARAQLAGARAALAGAQASLAGAQADERGAAARVAAADAALEALALTAPFAGTVVEIGTAVGDLVQPGAVVVRLADLAEWRFETSDLSETSVARVAAGQPVTVTVDGLPGDDIAGTVETVGGYGTSSQGDIVFTVVAAPTSAVPGGLRWNMTVTLEIDTAGGG